jgi:hypothetical protein
MDWKNVTLRGLGLLGRRRRASPGKAWNRSPEHRQARSRIQQSNGSLLAGGTSSQRIESIDRTIAFLKRAKIEPVKGIRIP